MHDMQSRLARGEKKEFSMERETAQTPTTQSTTQGGQSFLRDEEIQREDSPIIERGRAVLEEGGEKVAGAAQRVAQRTREVASNVKTRAGEIGSRVVERTDAAMSAAGERIENLGHSLRDRASEEGRVGKVLSRTAQALEHGGQYLQESTPGDVRMDLEDVMRRRPVATLLVGAGIGFLIARALRRRD
jgi:ElaB/YqjD/DUF883 family membrane-anchored ribosome-binding protein